MGPVRVESCCCYVKSSNVRPNFRTSSRQLSIRVRDKLYVLVHKPAAVRSVTMPDPVTVPAEPCRWTAPCRSRRTCRIPQLPECPLPAGRAGVDAAPTALRGTADGHTRFDHATPTDALPSGRQRQPVSAGPVVRPNSRPPCGAAVRDLGAELLQQLDDLPARALPPLPFWGSGRLRPPAELSDNMQLNKNC